MAQNLSNFPIEEAQQLARSTSGQELLQLLQQGDGAKLDEAAALLQQGNAQQAKALLLPILEDPKILALLRQLGG